MYAYATKQIVFSNHLNPLSVPEDDALIGGKEREGLEGYEVEICGSTSLLVRFARHKLWFGVCWAR